MAIQIFECEQGTPEWHECRRGIPTASDFHIVIASGRGGGPSVTRRKYMLRKASERITGKVEESYENADMKRGRELEPEALSLLALVHGVELTRVGFVRNGDMGCSPDSLIGKDGLVQVKTQKPELHLETLLTPSARAAFAQDHQPQVQGELMVTERKYCILMSYWPGLPPVFVRVERDESYIGTLRANIIVFNRELAQVVESIKKG